MSRRKQRGGGDLQDVKLWGQDQVPPNSYKIQLSYVEIPRTVRFQEKWLDAPYRFNSFHDANQEADRIFAGYNYRIVGSNDNPHWDAPGYLNQTREARELRTDRRWYNVVGVKPVESNPYGSLTRKGEPPVLAPSREYVMKELSKLRGPVGSTSKEDKPQTKSV